MSIYGALAAVAYVLAVLFALGWLVGQSIPRAVALIAAGLFLALLSGATIHLPRKPPPSG